MTDADIPEPDALAEAPHPRNTRALFGQGRAEDEFLKAFQQDRLHHAWLITGPRGVGKATLAWKIARFLLSQPQEDEGGLFNEAPAPAASLETSSETPLAHRMVALAEPRLFLCRRPWDDKNARLKKDITVDEVRKLKSFFNLSATDGGRRVVIVDAADEMNVSAANALLKILEEPPDKATLLLISHRPMRLLPTIRSRCRVLKCESLNEEAMASALAGAGYDSIEDTAGLAALAGGSVGEAIRLLSDDGISLYGALVRAISSAPGMARPPLIALAESCVGKNAEARYDLCLRLISILLHRLAMIGTTGLLQPEAIEGEASILARLSPGPDSARAWADLADQLQGRSAHARAVNLDPASVILDMLLKIDQTAGREVAA